jgi:serine protease Do
MFCFTKKLTLALLSLSLLLLSSAQSALSEDSSVWVDAKENTDPVELTLPSFRPIIEKLGPSVVNISIEGEVEIDNPFASPKGRGNIPEQFAELFPYLQQPELKQPFQSLGSGFVIHQDGYIVTNNHVVEKATKISVRFKDDKKSYEAEVVGQDSRSDIALLKLKEKREVQPVYLGDSDDVETGDWVIAIGNPFRLGHTATVGIVSAKSRRVEGALEEYIQTDASINPGNSGGPLFNARGDVIGMNTAIFSPGRLGSAGFNIGIGFAIPINTVKDIISQLRKDGKVTRGWLGVYIQPITDDVAQALKLEHSKGALVAKVIDGGPAKLAGILRRDVLLTFDGKAIEENEDLPAMVAQTPIGKVIEVGLLRNGKKKTIKVKIAELKDESAPEEQEPEKEDITSKLGMSVQDLTADVAESLGVDEIEGIIISQIQPNSTADKAGLRRGDIILEVGSKTISSTADFLKSTNDLPNETPVLLLIRRGDSTIFLTLKIEE